MTVPSVGSKRRTLGFGMPQCSVLGPSLFIIYAILIGGILRRHGLCFHAHAGDQQIYIFSDASNQAGMESAMATLLAGIAVVRPWMAASKLQVNHAKTDFLAVLPKKHNRVVPGLKIGHSIVTPSHSALNLGAQFDSCASMESQISAMC